MSICTNILAVSPEFSYRITAKLQLFIMADGKTSRSMRPLTLIPLLIYYSSKSSFKRFKTSVWFQLNHYNPTFIQKKKTELGSIMNQIGYARYDKQWWDDFRSKLYDCKNKRNDCCHTRLFRWENLETLLETMFYSTESKHHNKIGGLMFESRVGLLMKEK